MVMRSEIRRDLTRSAQALADVVWPQISQPWFGGGEVVPVETATDVKIAKALDVFAGIDLWLLRKDGITPIASRVQFPDGRSYNTFTIRSWRKSGNDVELQRRLRALKEVQRGYLFPHVTIQAYVDNNSNRLIAAACVLTKDLFEHVDEYDDVTNRDGQSGFKVAGWSLLEQLGANIRVHWPDPKRDSRQLDLGMENTSALKRPDPPVPYMPPPE